jgi:hypothetical protein
MKKLILTLAALVAIQVHAGSLDGLWKMQNRICVGANGIQPTTDGFILGRDKMELSIKGSYGLVTTTMDGQQYFNPADVNQNLQHVLSVLSSRNARTIYVMSNADTVDFIDADFGPGGSCVGGQLFTIFTRVTAN